MDKSSLITYLPSPHVIQYSYSLFNIDKGMNRREVAITLILYAKWLTNNPYYTRLSWHIYKFYHKGKVPNQDPLRVIMIKRVSEASNPQIWLLQVVRILQWFLQVHSKRKQPQVVENTSHLITKVITDFENLLMLR